MDEGLTEFVNLSKERHLLVDSEKNCKAADRAEAVQGMRAANRTENPNREPVHRKQSVNRVDRTVWTGRKSWKLEAAITRHGYVRFQ